MEISMKSSKELDRNARAAVALYEGEAFDNVDIDRLLDEKPLSRSQAVWIARNLILNSRTTAAFIAGQALSEQALSDQALSEKSHAA